MSPNCVKNLLLCICSWFFIAPVFAQHSINPEDKNPNYENEKKKYYQSLPIRKNTKTVQRQSSVQSLENTPNGCFIPLDSTFKLAISYNDDGSSAPITLPFTFNLYGKSYSQVWINNNGNLTFTGSFSTYNASGFPFTGTPMIAGFWGDIDTRGTASGDVYYKLYPTRLVVTWDHVGYYSYGSDLLNTFQIVIGVVGDSVLGNQNNVNFYYKDMQWASSHGFGGNPSTVGINAGDGENYVQVGRFSYDNSTYDGPGNDYDGINFLDNQCFSFDATSSGNIPPSALNLPFTTTTLNVGDTVSLSPQFIGPEVEQTVISTVNTTMCNVDDSITNGVISTVRLKIKADTCNIGSNVITITATDNGSPTRSTAINITVNVNKLNQSVTFNAIPAVTYGDVSSFNLQATATSGLPVSYSVVSGPAYVSGNTLTITGVGTVTVRAYQSGNSQYNASSSVDQSFCVKAGQPSDIAGITEVCPGTQYTYSITAVSGATLYTWSATGGAIVASSGSTARITFPVAGTYTVSVKYKGNCDTGGVARSLTVQAYSTPLTGSITKMLPADGSTGLFFPITFSWTPIENALYYDLYIWPSSGIRPATPYRGNITQITYTVYSGLSYDTLYKWQVIAKKACYGIESNVQTFKLRSLPDVIVQSITTPATATSESQITVKWTIKNQGKGTTDHNWTDAVYVSDLPVFDNSAKLLGQFYNVSALSSNQSYTNTQGLTYTIPVGAQGSKYFYVKTNAGNQLLESDYTNDVKSDSVVVTLAPPPDLQITALSLNPSSSIIAGNNIKVNYTVANKGTGPTGASVWYDKVYLSDSVGLNTSKDKLLATITHNGKLQVNASYKDSATVQIPVNIYGRRYIHVFTDANKNVFEYLQDENNVATSDSLSVFLNPSPNLTVNNVLVQADTVTNRQPVTIQWVEKNIGTASAKPTWYNNVYLSTDTVLNTSLDIYLGSVTRNTELVQQTAYNGSLTTPVSSGIQPGRYYVFVVTDPQNYIFESDANVADAEKDNSARSVSQLTIISPDLRTVSVKNQDTASSEDTITVSYQVDNISRVSLYNGSWYDRIYLSDDTLLSGNDVLLSDVSFSNTFVAANGSYFKNQNVVIPRGATGKKYIIVSADNNNYILENSETNNTLYNELYIKLSPYPDLTVTSVSSVSRDTVSRPFTVNYTVKNNGAKPISGQTWTDYIYLSREKNVNATSLIYLGSVTNNTVLNAGAVYNRNASFILPLSLDTGKYYPLVFADAQNTVYEYTLENNNKEVASDSVIIKSLPVMNVDLAVDSAYTTESSIKAGARIPITWIVENRGPDTAIIPRWQDAIYLSPDTVRNGNDKLLLVTPVQQSLQPGQSYRNTQSVSIPQDVSGAQYILVTADYANEVSDNSRGNNTRIISIKSSGTGNGGTIGDTIVITQPLPADLTIDTLQVPAEGTASQPVTISYTIKNTGTGITQSNNWRDRIYLSTDFVISYDDSLLGSFSRNDSLAAGAGYTNTQQVFLPRGTSGNYIVLFKTDADNNIYEKNGEDNNDAYTSIFIKAQLPCDLQSDSVQSLSPVIITGEPATFQWKLLNKGDNPAAGYIREAVYLSKDTIWDDKDALLGYTDDQVSILPNAFTLRQLTARPDVSPGQYYPIVRADILNNLEEVNEDNNDSHSANPVTVDVKQLLLNITTADTLEMNLPIYYRFQVPDSLIGETLSVLLKGDSANHAVNRLFISHDTLPTDSRYEFSAQVPFQANQQALVPAMLPGNYYITATGIPSSALPQQPVMLLAQTIPFSILSVDAKQGGNTGTVTIKMMGAKFEPAMVVKLKGAIDITAQKVSLINSTEAYVTFNLTGAPTGTYTVTATNSGNKTAQLTNGFEIVAGSAGGSGSGTGLTCTIENIGYDNNFLLGNEHPASTRPNTIVVITVSFYNAGNVDIPVQNRLFISTGGAPISFNTDFSQNSQQLLLVCKEEGGPDDILRPGAKGYYKIYALASAPLSFIISK